MSTTIAELAQSAGSVRHHALLLVNRTFSEQGLDPADFALLAEGFCGVQLDPADVWQAAERHPDVFVVDRERGILRIEDVAPIRQQAMFPPNLARRRLFLVDRCERLNANAANSLLKVVEEPEISALFVFTARARTEVLQTIASRCQVISVAIPGVVAQLPREALETEDWEWLARMVARLQPGPAVAMESTWDSAPLGLKTGEQAEILKRSQQIAQKSPAPVLQDAVMALLAARLEREPALASAARFFWADLAHWRDAAPMNPSSALWLTRLMMRCANNGGS